MASKKRAPTHLHKHPCDTVLATHHKPYQQPESCFFVCLFVAAHDNQKTREEVHALNVAKFFVVDTSRVTGTANREGHTTDCEKTTVGWMGSMWSKKCLKRYVCTSRHCMQCKKPDRPASARKGVQNAEKTLLAFVRLEHRYFSECSANVPPNLLVVSTGLLLVPCIPE